MGELSRRGLLVGGLGAGAVGFLPIQPDYPDVISNEYVANCLTCCVGAIDFALVLGLKTDFEKLRDSADGLIPQIDNLNKRMPQLIERLKPLNVQSGTRSFAVTTTASTEEMARALQQLKPRLDDMLNDEVLSGQTSDSLALFVSKTSSVASLMAQVAQSLILLRRALEKENISTNEYESFIEGKLDAWGSILYFMEVSRNLSQHHADLSQAVKKAKMRVEAAVVALHESDHGDLEAQLSAGLASDLEPVRQLVKPEDKDAFMGTIDLLAKSAGHVGKKIEDPVLMASMGGAYSGLRDRVTTTLTSATNRKATTYQISIVVLAARTASFLPSPSSQKNVIATAILLMLPRLSFDPRNLTKALALAEAILTA